MIEASCHCGAVRLEIDAAPETVTDCNCSICRRYGVLWAYYSPTEVRLEPADVALDRYLWDDRSIAFNRCRVCGCVTHWSAEDPGRDRMGVNARLMDPEVLAGARVRRLDGAVTERYLDEE
ncbi:MAG: GFA family protein [Caulobacter sp.]|nr:GFA family protein [Caulobacter sp.]